MILAVRQQSKCHPEGTQVHRHRVCSSCPRLIMHACVIYIMHAYVKVCGAGAWATCRSDKCGMALLAMQLKGNHCSYARLSAGLRRLHVPTCWRGGCVRLFPARQPYETEGRKCWPHRSTRSMIRLSTAASSAMWRSSTIIESESRSLSSHIYLCAHAANTPPLSLTIDLVPHKSSSWLPRPLDAATSLARSSRATKRASERGRSIAVRLHVIRSVFALERQHTEPKHSRKNLFALSLEA